MWEQLDRHKARVAGRSLIGLFEDDPERAQSFSAQTAHLRFDFSKTQIDAAVLADLLDLIAAHDVETRREAMFAGAPINETEGRAVLHTALRNLDGGPVVVDGDDVMPSVLATLGRMTEFADEIRASEITDVINIGIGGSDLGPAMATLALAPYHDGPRCHFLSNVDGAHAADILRGLDARKTLVIVASKTFTTIETMTNARTLRAWLVDQGCDPAQHLAAVSTALDKTEAFGIPAARVFGFADWVGGRYSLWGPIGLPLMLAIGPAAFRAFLRGGQEMDRHFRAAAPAQNLPMLLALVGIWHRQVLGYPSRAVLPYEQRLLRLPAYLQQLEMESNGKSTRIDGTPVPGASGPIVWGEPGTNGQHAFYQLIHQGTDVIPCEFMVAARAHEPELQHHHDLLVANCLAQSEALMRGRSIDEARAKLSGKFDGAELDRQAAHRVFSGNRPSTTLLYDRLDPFTLGQIIALYEHRVFVEGVILGINSFDQWGVELGKELATALGPIVEGTTPPDGKDGSTVSLIGWIHGRR